MITGFFLRVLYIIMAFFVGLLPSSVFPPEITQGVQTAWYWINAFSWLFPVGTLLSVLALATLFHGSLIIWHGGHLVLRYIRGR